MLRTRLLLPSPGLVLPVLCCISPGPGTVGSLIIKLFIKDDRLRSKPVFLAGDALLEERWRPALIAAAACNDDRLGDLGEGGLGRSALLIDILRGLDCNDDAVGDDEEGSEFKSGAMSIVEYCNQLAVQRIPGAY